VLQEEEDIHLAQKKTVIHDNSEHQT